MEKYKISIIVPIYKVEQYLENCIDSIIQQSYKNLEIILVDDGSPDSCGKICDKYKENDNDNRIIVIHKTNGGLSSARNAGLNIASGDFIGFVDSDDTIDVDMYEHLIKNAMQFNADISHCGHNLYLLNGKKEQHKGTQKKYITNNIEALKMLLKGDIVEPGVCSKIYKRSCFSKFRFDESIHKHEDIPANYYLFSIAKVIVFHDICKYNYIKRQGSITASFFSESDFDLFKISKYIMEDIFKTNRGLLDFGISRASSSCVDLYNRLLILNDIKWDTKRKELVEYLEDNINLIKKSKVLRKKTKIAILLILDQPNIYKKIRLLYQYINKFY